MPDVMSEIFELSGLLNFAVAVAAVMLMVRG